MARFLIVFDSKHGQTKKIADFIGRQLESVNHTVKISDTALTGAALADYDSIIIGAPVYAGKFHRCIKRWTKQNAAILSTKRAAFFSVCLGILQTDEKTQREERRFVESFFHQTNWFPQVWTIFAGALNYSKYNWFIKAIMKRISKKAGVTTNTKTDYEFTDWAEVSHFTEKVLLQLEPSLKFRDACPVELKW